MHPLQGEPQRLTWLRPFGYHGHNPGPRSGRPNHGLTRLTVSGLVGGMSVYGERVWSVIQP
jgi:hypothetical protein